jgi:tetratricopeptide (TPR) repeat protein
MKRDLFLSKAIRLIRQGKPGKAVDLLETEADRYRGSFHYYFLLASACLRQREFGGALDYFKLARQVRMKDPRVLLGMAALYMRRKETDRAIEYYLEVLDEEPKNPQAKLGIKMIRKYADTEYFHVWVDSKQFEKIYPPIPQPVFRWGVLLASVLLLAAASVLILNQLGVIHIIPIGRAGPERGRIREGMEDGALTGNPADWVQVDGSFRYVLTTGEVAELYNTARRLFAEYHDERAKVALNKLLESNASEGVKERARQLISYMAVPGFDTLKDKITFSEVKKEPWLYNNCYVIWRGKAANLNTADSTTDFNLLVGYDNASALEGVVPVHLMQHAPINLEQPLEVLGRIVPTVTEEGMTVRLEGIAIHQTGMLQ